MSSALILPLPQRCFLASFVPIGRSFSIIASGFSAMSLAHHPTFFCSDSHVAPELQATWVHPS